MKSIQQGYADLDVFTTKASVLTQVIGVVLLAVGIACGDITAKHYGTLILAINVLHYTATGLVLQGQVRTQEILGKKSISYSNWVPYVGWVFFTCKVIATFLALYNIGR